MMPSYRDFSDRERDKRPERWGGNFRTETDRDDRPLPPRRQDSARSSLSAASPTAASNPRDSFSQADKSQLSASSPQSKQNNSNSSNQMPATKTDKDVVKILDLLSDRTIYFKDRREAAAREAKFSQSMDNLRDTSYAADISNLQTRRDQSSAMKSKAQSRMEDIDPHFLTLLLAILDKHHKPAAVGPSKSLMDVQQKTMEKAIQFSLMKKMDDKFNELGDQFKAEMAELKNRHKTETAEINKQYKTETAELTRRLNAEEAKNKALGIKLQEVSDTVDQLNDANANAVAQLNSLKADIDIPSLIEMQRTNDKHEQHIARLQSRLEEAEALGQQQQKVLDEVSQQTTQVVPLQDQFDVQRKQLESHQQRWETHERHMEAQQQKLEAQQQRVDTQEHKLLAQDKEIAKLKFQHGTQEAFESWARQTTATQQTNIDDLKKVQEASEARAEQTSKRVEQLESRAQQQSIAAVVPKKDPAPVPDPAPAATEELHSRVTSLHHLYKDVVADVRVMDRKLGEISTQMDNIRRDPRPKSLTPAASVDGQCTQLPSPIGPFDDVSESVSRIRKEIDSKIKQQESHNKQRFETIANGLGNIIDQSRREVKAALDKLEASSVTYDKKIADVTADISSLRQETREGVQPQKEDPRVSQHDTLIRSHEDAIMEIKDQIHRRSTLDDGRHEDLSMAITDLGAWQDNFRSTEIAQAMVNHLNSAVPGAMQLQIRHLSDRVSVVESQFNSPREGGEFKKRKTSNGTPLLVSPAQEQAAHG